VARNLSCTRRGRGSLGLVRGMRKRLCLDACRLSLITGASLNRVNPGRQTAADDGRLQRLTTSNTLTISRLCDDPVVVRTFNRRPREIDDALCNQAPK